MNTKNGGGERSLSPPPPRYLNTHIWKPDPFALIVGRVEGKDFDLLKRNIGLMSHGVTDSRPPFSRTNDEEETFHCSQKSTIDCFKILLC